MGPDTWTWYDDQMVEEDEAPIRAEVGGMLSDEGTVVIFDGLDLETGEVVRFGVDHRPAQVLCEALLAGEALTVALEPWQILMRMSVL